MMNGNPKKRVCAAVLTEGAVHICNLYNLTTNQQAIRDFVALTHDSIGNLEPTLDVHPDRPAPVARNTDGGLELARLTWGMPTPVEHLKTPDAPDWNRCSRSKRVCGFSA